MGALYPLRVVETTTTTGTGTITLAGVPNATYRSFAAALGAGTSRVRYVIEWDGGYEIGIGSFNGTDQLTRSRVIRSSNGDAVVSLPAGAKTCFTWNTAAEPEFGFTAALSADQVMTLDGGQGLFTGTSPTTQPLPAVAALPAGFMVSFRNAGTAVLTLDPDAAETIGGGTTLALAVGQRVTLYRRPGGWESVGPVATAADLAALSAASLKADGSVPMTAALPAGGQKITGLANGTAAQDAATFGQVQAALVNSRIIIQERLADGASAGSATAGAWTARGVTLTEVLDPGNHATVSAATFTLAAGTYDIRTRVPFSNNVSGVRTRLFNVTDAAAVPDSLSETGSIGNPATYNTNIYYEALFRVTIGATKTFRLEYFAALAGGAALALGTHDQVTAGQEIYATIDALKVA